MKKSLIISTLVLVSIWTTFAYATISDHPPDVPKTLASINFMMKALLASCGVIAGLVVYIHRSTVKYITDTFDAKISHERSRITVALNKAEKHEGLLVEGKLYDTFMARHDKNCPHKNCPNQQGLKGA